MPRVTWTVQNEETDDDGFLLQDSDAMAAERDYLAAAGCPDTDKIGAGWDIVVVDRDEGHAMADVTDAMAEWLRAEDLLLDEEDSE